MHPARPVRRGRPARRGTVWRRNFFRNILLCLEADSRGRCSWSIRWLMGQQMAAIEGTDQDKISSQKNSRNCLSGFMSWLQSSLLCNWQWRRRMIIWERLICRLLSLKISKLHFAIHFTISILVLVKLFLKMLQEDTYRIRSNNMYQSNWKKTF